MSAQRCLLPGSGTTTIRNCAKIAQGLNRRSAGEPEQLHFNIATVSLDTTTNKSTRQITMRESVIFLAWSLAMSSSNAAVQSVSAELPAMPLTLEGLSVLHQMFLFRWAEWRKLDSTRQADIAREAAAVFSASEQAGPGSASIPLQAQ